jgi:hypothetical protein
MTKRQAIKLFGGVCELARAIGVRSQAVSQWPEGEIYEPRASQVKLRAIEYGLLKLSVVATRAPSRKCINCDMHHSNYQQN